MAKIVVEAMERMEDVSNLLMGGMSYTPISRHGMNVAYSMWNKSTSNTNVWGDVISAIATLESHDVHGVVRVYNASEEALIKSDAFNKYYCGLASVMASNTEIGRVYVFRF